MASAFGVFIRDGLESDIASCLDLDCTYETDFVWQMNIQEDNNQYRITFKTERLPRTLSVDYPASAHRLKLALPEEQCFLVAIRKSDEQLLAYLTMHHDPVHKIGQIQDVVVSQPFRRRGIGTRLLKIARQWASERDLVRITVETQTKNYPSILFCQAAGLHFCGFNDQHFQNQDIAIFFNKTLH